MPDEDDEEPLNLFAKNAIRQSSIIPHLLRAKDGEQREHYLNALRATLSSNVRVYYEEGLRVYYERDPSMVGYPFGKAISFSAVYIEEVLPDGSANVSKSLLGSHKLARTTEPQAPSVWDVIQGDEYD